MFCWILSQISQVSVRFLPQKPLDSVRFYLRSSKSVRITLGVPSFCHILPLEPLVLLEFTSDSPSVCQILPQEPLDAFRFQLSSPQFLSDFNPRNPELQSDFYLSRLQFLSVFASGVPNFCQILPWEPLVPDFISGVPSLCQILLLGPPVSVRFYLRSPEFLSDFNPRTPQFLGSLTFCLRSPSFCQILLQTSLVSQILHQEPLVSVNFT